MFRNASDTSLSLLRPDNRIYGFAIEHALDAAGVPVECSSIHNQILTKDYKSAGLQGIERCWGMDDLPDVPEFFGWRLKVLIEPCKDFNEQSCRLTRCQETFRDKDAVWLSEVTRVMTLRAFFHVASQPQKTWDSFMGCFEIDEKESCEYEVPSSELLPKA